MRFRVALVALAAVAPMGLTACGGGAGKAEQGSTTTTSFPVRHAAPITTPTVTIEGRTYPVPTEDGGVLPAQGQAMGTQVVIRDDGVLPEELIAPENAVITWTNLSSSPATVHFLTGGFEDSRSIAVGGTFTYTTPGRYNFAYRTSTHGQGQVYVGAFSGAGT